MLENYPLLARTTEAQTQRKVLAMAAALEIAKASAGSTTAKTHSDKIADDLKFASQNIEALASAIQRYIDN